MTEKEDIEPKNDKGEWHGYQEWYYIDYTIMHRGIYKNGEPIYYHEYHEHHDYYDDSQSNTSFYIR